MGCPGGDGLLDLALGELKDAERAPLEAHLGSCAACRAAADEQAALLELVRRHPAEEPPRHLRERILSALRAERTREAPWRARWAASFRPASALAAAAALGAALVLTLAPGRGPSGPPTSTQPVAAAEAAVRLEAGARQELDWRGRGSLTFDGPARALLEPAGVALARGRLTVVVQPGPEGFFVATPEARVTVQGTRFVVDASEQGRTRVEVAEGSVDVRSLRTGARALVTAAGPREWDSSAPPVPAAAPAAEPAAAPTSTVPVPPVTGAATMESNPFAGATSAGGRRTVEEGF